MDDKKEREKFKEKSYWEERYQSEESFDWFCDLSSFDHLLSQHVQHTDRILNLGCGNSNLSTSLYQRGYKNIENVDFSETVIARMKDKSSSLPELKWHVMDMLDLQFDRESFDVVLDKGSIDSLMVDQSSAWNPERRVIERVERALAEAFRVLKLNGRFISITFSQPHFRGPLLYQPNKFLWSLKHWCFGDSFHYYFFVATKRENKAAVLDSQEFNYSYPSLYKRTSNETAAVQYYEDSDNEDYLLNIGELQFEN